MFLWSRGTVCSYELPEGAVNFFILSSSVHVQNPAFKIMVKFLLAAAHARDFLQRVKIPFKVKWLPTISRPLTSVRKFSDSDDVIAREKGMRPQPLASCVTNLGIGRRVQ